MQKTLTAHLSKSQSNIQVEDPISTETHAFIIHQLAYARYVHFIY